MMGELFQNNHHKSPNDANFAKKWFELDPTWYIIRLLQRAGVIRLRKIPARRPSVTGEKVMTEVKRREELVPEE
jgi:stearoyl-CoA desaturase (delta-9 desaturase)